jgi:S-adenosylmethionine hydrolase
MAVVTLLTDFGTADEYVGVMKGVMLSICPSLSVIDISHRIKPRDIVQAAYMIPAYFHFFPAGTIHIVVVDPGVGSQRGIVAIRLDQHFFLAPDNGVLSLLLRDQKSDTIIEVSNSDYFLEPLSTTFHGRDIFAALGGHLACGAELDALGTKITTQDLVQLSDLACRVSESGELVGRIVSVDRFGNLITNIDAIQLGAFFESNVPKQPFIRIGSLTIRGLAKTYADVAPEAPLALIGSRGYMEIAVNCGSAQSQLKAAKGDPIRITLS